MAEEDVADPERRRQHGLVLPRPLDRGEDREARLAGGSLHRGCGEQAGRDEVDVRNVARSRGRMVDERAETDPERGEVEDGVDDARGDRAAPHTPVADEPELV